MAVNCYDCGLPIGDGAYVQLRVRSRMVRKHADGECRIAVDRALAKVEADRDTLREALTELVTLKRMKDATDPDSPVDLAERVTDYERRKPAAWAAAFALIPE